ncbi:MAG: transglutaminase-like domain-containing protein [Phycisphaerales bacterium]
MVAHCASAQQPLEATWSTSREYWYTLELNNQRAGYSHHTIESEEATGNIRTTVLQVLHSQRGEGVVAGVSIETVWTETSDGSPISMSMARRLSQQPQIIECRFLRDGSIERRTRIGNGTWQIATHPTFTQPWLPPDAQRRFIQQRRAADARSISFHTLDLSADPVIATVTMTRSENAVFEHDGVMHDVEVWQINAGRDERASRSLVHVSEDGVIVLAQEIAGGLTLIERLATRALALQPITHLPDIIAATTVKPDTPIRSAARVRRALYELRITNEDDQDEGVFDIPSAASQMVLTDAESGPIRILVDPAAPFKAAAGDTDEPLYRASSLMINYDEPSVRAFSARALNRRSLTDVRARAERLRTVVFQHIRNKNLASTFASASETLATRSGDCTEHAVLLCALLRADGIPARVACGLVYAEEFAGQNSIFAWHMWTQALIDGYWIDLDATALGPFSAAHILFGTTALADGAVEREIVPMTAIVGRIEIRVVDLEY